MTNLEVKAWREEEQARRAKYLARAREHLQKEVPGLEWDEKKARIVAISDVDYYVSNLEYYHIDYVYGASLRKTDLGYSVARAEQYGDDYQLIEVGDYYKTLLMVYKPYMAGGYVSDTVTVEEYNPETGTRRKGRRRNRSLHQSTKGLYFEQRGKRVYLKWQVPTGA